MIPPLTPTFTLNNGISMPRVGLGTYMLSGTLGKLTMKQAIKLGYRLFDTATLYGNEQELGEALAESGLSRQEFFITTKVWNSDQGYASTLRAFETSLKQLNLEYVDLYLIHWPVPGKRKDTWRALEKLYSDEKCRAIGVSNYYIPHIEELLSYALIPPMVNQVEFSPFLFLPELLTYCKSDDILLQCYSPLTHGNRIYNSVIQSVAQSYQKKEAQVLLKWCLQHNTSVIPKASSKKHLEENIALFDFELSSSDMLRLDQLHENLHTDWDPSTVL
ncbi:aldo/keto reductase [Candidatus Lokiarchaeum ossiferum]|uniref:aldo/keto reductase n=1 Tax=Candidatus Lokiarchaeum ossiferum TaxID=2951803 RepID=UPI00352DE4D6